MPKLVQINWVGAGVPETRKGLFHIQSGQVGSFFQGAHLTIQARSEADLDQDFIMKRVKQAGGSKYSCTPQSFFLLSLCVMFLPLFTDCVYIYL